MRIACSTLAYCKKPLETAAARISALGFRYADLAVLEGWAHINPSDLVDGADEAADRIGALFAKRNLTCVALNCGLGPGAAEELKRRFEGVAALAQALDAPVVTLPGGAGSVEEAAAALRPMADIAAREGLCLTAETHVGNVTERPADAARLCAAVPGLMLTLDPSHFTAGPARGEDMGPAFPYTRHVHIRDAGTTPDALQLPYGTGSVDTGALIARLLATGYQGAVSVEYIEGFGPGAIEESIAKAVEDLRQILAQHTATE